MHSNHDQYQLGPEHFVESFVGDAAADQAGHAGPGRAGHAGLAGLGPFLGTPEVIAAVPVPVRFISGDTGPGLAGALSRELSQK